MPKHPDKYVKNAMWEAHGKKCFYCNEPMAYKNVQLDHVIPSSAFQGHEQELVIIYQLNASFDFNGLDNLVPACQSCNTSRKRAAVLENAIPFWLKEANKVKDEIIHKSTGLKLQLSLDLPDEYKEFFLSSPDFTLSELSLEKIRKSDINLYKTLAFRSDLFPFTLFNEETGEETNIRKAGQIFS